MIDRYGYMMNRIPKNIFIAAVLLFSQPVSGQSDPISYRGVELSDDDAVLQCTLRGSVVEWIGDKIVTKDQSFSARIFVDVLAETFVWEWVNDSGNLSRRRIERVSDGDFIFSEYSEAAPTGRFERRVTSELMSLDRYSLEARYEFETKTQDMYPGPRWASNYEKSYELKGNCERISLDDLDLNRKL